MRLCVLVPRFPVLSQTFVVDHVAGMLERGHEVVVVPLASRRPTDGVVSDDWEHVVRRVSPDPPQATGGVAAEVVQTVALARRRRPRRYALQGPLRPRDLGSRLLCATRVERAAPFDVMHAHFGETGLRALAMRDAGLFEAPVVTSFHGHDANVRSSIHPGLYDELARKGDAVTVGTAFMRGVVTDLGFAPDAISQWPQGVDLSQFTPVPPSSAEGFRVLTVARLVDFKGVDVSLRAIAAARSEIPGLRYRVIGDGARRAELEALARELGVADIVTFAGGLSHDDVRTAFAHADCFMLTGRTDAEGQKEGQGVAPLEASASGLPVLATRSGGLEEVVLDGETGILVEPEDADAAATALIGLARDQGMRRRMGTAGRAHVERAFSRQHSLDVIDQVYRGLTSETPRRSRRQ